LGGIKKSTFRAQSFLGRVPEIRSFSDHSGFGQGKGIAGHTVRISQEIAKDGHGCRPRETVSIPDSQGLEFLSLSEGCVNEVWLLESCAGGEQNGNGTGIASHNICVVVRRGIVETAPEQGQALFDESALVG
jgi:hypothetical protein